MQRGGSPGLKQGPRGQWGNLENQRGSHHRGPHNKDGKQRNGPAPWRFKKYQKKNWVWWKNVLKSKESRANKFMKRKSKLFKKLKKQWYKCMQKTKDNMKKCSTSILVKKAKFWKKHHNKFWRENLMRWKAIEIAQKTVVKFTDAKDSVEKDGYKSAKYYKDQINEKLQNFKEKAMNEIEKDEILSIKKKMKDALKLENMADDLKVYEKQKSDWENSNAGKCLKLRAKSFLLNLGSLAGKEVSKQDEGNFKKEVDYSCQKVPVHLPFSNGGCLDKLELNYKGQTMGFSNFLKNKSGDNARLMINGLNNAQLIILENCIKPLIENSFIQCKEYIEKKLYLGELLKVADLDNSTQLALNIAMQWNNFGNAMKTLVDENFWLNAPRECGIGKDLRN